MIVSPSTDRLRATWHRRVPSLHVGGWRLGALLALTVGTAVALNAIAGLLVTMHPPNVPGRGLAQGLGTNGLGGGVEAALATLDTWRTFDGLSYSADLSSAFTIATAWLLLDFVFVILYTTSVLALTRPAGPLSGGGTANTLAATRALVLALAAVDIVENTLALTGVLTGSTSTLLFSSLFAARAAKMFLLVPPTLALLALLWLRRLRVLLGEPRVRQGLVMARPQIIVVVMISLALWYEPTSDVLLDLGMAQTVAMGIFGGFLCAGLGIGARVLIDRDRVSHGASAGWYEVGGRGSTGAKVALLVTVALLVLGFTSGWRGLWGASLVILSILAASWVLQDSGRLAPVEMGERPAARVPAALALAPLGVLGVALVHWTLWADIVLQEVPVKAISGVVMVVLAGALVAPIGKVVEAAQGGDPAGLRTGLARLVGAIAQRRGTYERRTWAAIATVTLAPVGLLLFGTRLVDPRDVGPMGLLFGAAATLNVASSALVAGADWWRDEFGMPSVFEALRMRRIPVFLLLVLWLVVNTVAFADPSYYDIDTSGTNRRITLEEAYADWKEAHLVEGAEAVPLVIVAAEGGGLRAAYWTERVLSELFPSSGLQPFALSGTSGGSVGVATYLARSGLHASTEAGGIGLADVPDPDFLSAVFQRWFTWDLAESLFRYRQRIGDRAAALADALADAIPPLRHPYDYAPADGSFQPVTVFNATDLQDGCLVLISTLSDLAGPAVSADELGCLDPDRPVTIGEGGFPGGVDIALECPGRGMSFATAAVVSARSPYVMPAGRLESCDGGVFYLADGGYVDNSGAVAAAVILQRLEALVAADNATGEACIVPILLQIDNGAESLVPGGQSTGNPPQLLMVITGALAANSARHDVAKMAAAAAVREPLTDATGKVIRVTATRDPDTGPQLIDRYLRIFPLAQAGRDATVGWMLSRPSKDALETQLEAAIADAALLLSPDTHLSCR